MWQIVVNPASKISEARMNVDLAQELLNELGSSLNPRRSTPLVAIPERQRGAYG